MIDYLKINNIQQNVPCKLYMNIYRYITTY